MKTMAETIKSIKSARLIIVSLPFLRGTRGYSPTIIAVGTDLKNFLGETSFSRGSAAQILFLTRTAGETTFGLRSPPSAGDDDIFRPPPRPPHIPGPEWLLGGRRNFDGASAH